MHFLLKQKFSICVLLNNLIESSFFGLIYTYPFYVLKRYSYKNPRFCVLKYPFYDFPTNVWFQLKNKTKNEFISLLDNQITVRWTSLEMKRKVKITSV